MGMTNLAVLSQLPSQAVLFFLFLEAESFKKKKFYFVLGVGKIPWRMKWQPTPIFLPRKPQGQKSLAACLWGLKRVGQDWATKQHSQLTTYHWMNVSPSCISCGLLALGSGVHLKAHQLWHGSTWKIILKKTKFDREKKTPKHTATSHYKKGNRNNKIQALVYIIKVQVRKKRTFLWWHMRSAQIQKIKRLPQFTWSIFLLLLNRRK